MHSTPIKSSKITNQTDQDAKSKHIAESERIVDDLKEDPCYLQHMFGSYYNEAQNNLRKVIDHQAVLLSFQRLANAPKDKLQRTVTDLLNVISFVHYKTHICLKGSRTSPGPRAIVFADKDRNLVKDDWNSARIQPDFTASATDEETLRSAIRDRGSTPYASFNTLIGVGEKVSAGKSVAVAKGQMSYYITSTRMYQPQLLMVHGFRLSNSDFTLWSHNPCGTCSSTTYPTIEDDDQKKVSNQTWELTLEDRPQALIGYIMHVLLLYHSLSTSLSCIRYNSAGYWDVYGMKVLPFYAARTPGRGSWVGFEVAIINKKLVIVGIVKIYWPDINAKFDEREILEHIHLNGEIPGIVLNKPLEVQIDEVEIGMEGFKIRRKLRIVRMESWGKHLSACKNVLDLLKVAYDAILAHWILCKRNVLHRDISWGNVLCKPIHGRNLQTPGEGPLDVLWIENVLGNPNGTPCALLTDFDHSAKISTLRDPAYRPRNERTGTPMFISVELSSKDEINREINLLYLDFLEQQIIGAEKHCGNIFNHAFPIANDNHAFLNTFMQAIPTEKKNTAKWTWSTTLVGAWHLPHHDIESFYWVFLWAFVRAQPKGSELESRPHRIYDSFCRTMITHIPGEEEERSNYLFSPKLDQILHPQLIHISRLFTHMSCYLTIPWRNYNVSPDHAHMALLRLLLIHIIDIQNNQAPNVEFADKPRTFHASGVIRSSLLTHSASNTSSNPIKRKPDEDEEQEGTSDPKKVRLESTEAKQPEQPDPLAIRVHQSLESWLNETEGADVPSTELDEVDTQESFAACQEMTVETKLNLGANKQ